MNHEARTSNHIPDKPQELPPGFGLRQSSGALSVAKRRPKAVEGHRSPRRCRDDASPSVAPSHLPSSIFHLRFHLSPAATG